MAALLFSERNICTIASEIWSGSSGVDFFVTEEANTKKQFPMDVARFPGNSIA